MPAIDAKKILPHSAAEMFELVADVERYPQFVPLCRELVVLERTAPEDGSQTITARMTVAYRQIIRESFISHVYLDRRAWRIDTRALEGPFSRLHSYWRFVPEGKDACEVQFFIDYEFRSRALKLLMNAVFHNAFRRILGAFERRADTLYPQGARPLNAPARAGAAPRCPAHRALPGPGEGQIPHAD